jgi:hypothetical protein
MVCDPLVLDEEGVGLVVELLQLEAESRNEFPSQRMSFRDSHRTELVLPIVIEISEIVI